MSSRGRGRGRGRGGFGFRQAKQVSFELFPEIEGLGKADYSTEHIQLIKWSTALQKFWNSSPYFVEDKSKQDERVQESYIERYSDRKSQTTNVKPQLLDYIKLGPGYMPAELAIGGKKQKHAAKRVKWNLESDLQKQDPFAKLLQKDQAPDQEGNDNKGNESEEEDDQINEEDEGEFSDEGDYGQPEYFDDDEDDYNMPEDDNDEPIY